MSQQRARLAVLASILLALAPRAARATQKFGPIQLSGNLQTANIVRTPDQNTYEYIMNRNTAHVRFDYDWLQSGKFYNKYDIPFLESSHLSIVWRGVYDSIYDTTPGFIQKEDIHGRAYPGSNGSFVNVFDFAKLKGGPGFARSALTVSGLSRRDRDGLKFDNQLREAYADIKLRNIPLSVRAGRQQIVWGETDNFRMLDRANSLDLTWHFQQEIPPPAYGWDEIRRPFWMLKFLYDVGDVWKLSQNFLEWYWNPGDWYPAKQSFLPRPWGLPFLNPLTNPVDGAFIGGVCSSSPFKFTKGPNAGQHFCTQLMSGTKLFEHGDYSRNPLDNSQVGVRYHAIAPFGLEFALVYFYQLFGSGMPFFDLAKETTIDNPALPGITKKNMWKGMLAFDRPTWIKSLNKKSTVFLTGQFFFHYLIDNPGCDAQRVFPFEKAKKAAGECLVGALDLPSSVRNGSVGNPSYRDKIRDWETLFTLAAFTFYRGGSILPVLGVAIDPTNQFSMEPFWTVDYVVRDDFVVNIAQRYFVTPMGHSTPIFETWGLAGINGGRSETELRLTYQF